MSEGECPTLVSFREELCIVTRPHLQRTVGTVLDTTFVDLSVCGSVRHDGPTYFKQRPCTVFQLRGGCATVRAVAEIVNPLIISLTYL